MKTYSQVFPNVIQGFGFASREAIFEAREFSKTQQLGCRQDCDTEVEFTNGNKSDQVLLAHILGHSSHEGSRFGVTSFPMCLHIR